MLRGLLDPDLTGRRQIRERLSTVAGHPRHCFKSHTANKHQDPIIQEFRACNPSDCPLARVPTPMAERPIGGWRFLFDSFWLFLSDPKWLNLSDSGWSILPDANIGGRR